VDSSPGCWFNYRSSADCVTLFEAWFSCYTGVTAKEFVLRIEYDHTWQGYKSVKSCETWLSWFICLANLISEIPVRIVYRLLCHCPYKVNCSDTKLKQVCTGHADIFILNKINLVKLYIFHCSPFSFYSTLHSHIL